MTIPNITQPTVIRARERPDFAGTFLTALLRGMEQAQERERLRLEEERLKLEKSRQKQEAEQAAAEAALQGQIGTGLQQGLLAEEPPTSIPLPGLRGPLPIPLQMPSGPFTTATAGAPPQAVPGIVGQMLPVVREARITRAEAAAARAERELDKALEAVPDKTLQDELRFWIASERAGHKLDPEVKKRLMPNLYPEDVPGGLWDTAMRWGALAAEKGTPVTDIIRTIVPARMLKNVDLSRIEGFVFPVDALGKQPKMSELQQKQFFLGGQMRQGLDKLDRLMRFDPATGKLLPGGVRINWYGEAVRSLREATGGAGGFLGGLGRFATKVVSAPLPEDQQLIIQLSLQIGNAYRYLVSGQQTSDREANLIFSYLTPEAGDKPAVIEQKMQFMHKVAEMSQAVARGELDGEVAYQRLAEQGRLLGVRGDVQEALDRVASGEARQAENKEERARFEETIGRLPGAGMQVTGNETNEELRSLNENLLELVREQRAARRGALLTPTRP